MKRPTDIIYQIREILDEIQKAYKIHCRTLKETSYDFEITRKLQFGFPMAKPYS